MRFFFLLVLLVCILGYVRAEQPATWNSWMVALGLSQLTESADVAASDAAPVASPKPTPPRQVPVNGLIQDGTFVYGNRFWQGDGQPDISGRGLVVTLNPSSWTRVYQTLMSDPGTLHSIEVTYRLSPGLALSPNPADYTGISKRLGISGFDRFESMAIPPGNFYGMIGDPDGHQICCEIYAPKLGSTDVQDYQHDYPSIPPNGANIFILAFPPGNGTVTLQTAYVTSH